VQPFEFRSPVECIHAALPVLNARGAGG
jgi:hypothetical protein